MNPPNKVIIFLVCQIHINISYLPRYLSTSSIIYECYLTCHSAHAEDFCVYMCFVCLYVFCRFAI